MGVFAPTLRLRKSPTSTSSLKRSGLLPSFARDEGGAISSLYAVGILVLVAMAGIGFDYGRLMTLNSELQNAADQAALAAATQLDGGSDAMTRARSAATNAFATATSSYVNQTRIANDGSGRPITNLTFQFYDSYGSGGDTLGTLLTSDTQGAQAQVVQVTVNARKVFYALTPLIGAFNSGNVIGKATAAIEAATCNVTPMFVCVPHDADDNNILDFPRPSDVGKELKLHLRDNASETFTPGNFSFLDVPWGTPSQKNLRLGLNTAAAGCFASTSDQQTNTGSRTPMAQSLNTRLDLYQGSMQPSDCNSSTGDFCPSENVTKNWVNVQNFNNSQNPPSCPSSVPKSSDTWISYDQIPVKTGESPPSNPGYPDDSAFPSVGTNPGILGNGDWSPLTWLTNNHPGKQLSDIPDQNGNGSISRYEAFLWELADKNKENLLQSPRVVKDDTTLGANGKWSGNLYCAYPKPAHSQAPAFPASASQKDRRILTVGTVACENGYPNGSKPVHILRWVDLFLVRPVNTGSETDFRAEIIGAAKQANGNSGFQYFAKRKVVLIR